jgi:ribosomal protein S21
MFVIEVTKNPNETSASIIRRFSKRMQGAGLLRKARSIRYKERAESPFVKKKHALKRIARQAETERLRKLGKIPDAHVKRHR